MKSWWGDNVVMGGATKSSRVGGWSTRSSRVGVVNKVVEGGGDGGLSDEIVEGEGR